jgi:hypothetical protein
MLRLAVALPLVAVPFCLWLTDYLPPSPLAGAPLAEPPLAEPTDGSEQADLRSSEPPAAPPLVVPPSLAWIAIGGGAEPESTQVSIEQDVAAFAAWAAPRPGLVLFGAGPSRQGVQMAPSTDATTDADTRDEPAAGVRRELGELFAPRAGRSTVYRPTTLTGAFAATRDNIGEVVSEALADPGELLTVYVAGHGEQGERRDENRWLTWGGDAITPADLAELLATGSRSARFIVTTCFAGGFAEIVFRDADVSAGPAERLHCGLFAAPWDLEASGCDPNPDRSAQESYSLHFLDAELDADGDGRVSPLEAHTHARIAGMSFDVPTSTSERWLEVTAPSRGRERPVEWPEEEAVVDALGEALGLRDEAASKARLDELERRLAELETELADLEHERDRHYLELRRVLLERWPTLDDPWHPETERVVQHEASAIHAVLMDSAEARAYAAAARVVDVTFDRIDPMLVQHAHLLRLTRAHDNLTRARRLAGRGGDDYARFEALLACERAP